MMYRARFIGKLLGAIGISYAHDVRVEAPNPEAARLKLYETHDHIHRLELEPIHPMDAELGDTVRWIEAGKPSHETETARARAHTQAYAANRVKNDEPRATLANSAQAIADDLRYEGDRAIGHLPLELRHLSPEDAAGLFEAVAREGDPR